jgi:hypothetical protein
VKVSLRISSLDVVWSSPSPSLSVTSIDRFNELLKSVVATISSASSSATFSSETVRGATIADRGERSFITAPLARGEGGGAAARCAGVEQGDGGTYCNDLHMRAMSLSRLSNPLSVSDRADERVIVSTVVVVEE